MVFSLHLKETPGEKKRHTEIKKCAQATLLDGYRARPQLAVQSPGDYGQQTARRVVLGAWIAAEARNDHETVLTLLPLTLVCVRHSVQQDPHSGTRTLSLGGAKPHVLERDLRWREASHLTDCAYPQSQAGPWPARCAWSYLRYRLEATGFPLPQEASGMRDSRRLG